MADINTSNNKNNLYYVFETIRIENIGLLSGFIYTDVNKIRQNSHIKLISTINNFYISLSTIKNGNSVDNNISQPMLIFYLKGNYITFNN